MDLGKQFQKIEHLGQIIIVDSELRKEDLVFVRGKSSLQSFHSFLIVHASFQNQGPECCVVQIVYMTVDLRSDDE